MRRNGFIRIYKTIGFQGQLKSWPLLLKCPTFLGILYASRFSLCYNGFKLGFYGIRTKSQEIEVTL